MEGRHPPPKASHPFPNNPDLTKFWGTPLQGAFFRSLACYSAVFFGLLGLNAYVKRNEKNWMGLPEPATLEQLEARRKMLDNIRPIMLSGANVGMEIENEVRNRDSAYSDRVGFNLEFTQPFFLGVKDLKFESKKE